nr:uncharacterized protein LOC111422857 [Onthophagus taurus]
MDFSDEINDDTGDPTYFNTNRYMLLAIDCNDQAYKEDLEGKSFFKTILSTCREFLDDQLIKKGGYRAGNRYAIVTVTDDKEKMIISNFNDNLPQVLKNLKLLCDKSDDELKGKFYRNSPFRFGEFLLNVRAMYKDYFSSDYLKQIVYISNDDDPVNRDEDQVSKAVNQAKAFEDTNIRFQLLTFNQEFDLNKFFQEVLYSWGNSTSNQYDYVYLTDTISFQDKLLSLLPLRGTKTKFYLLPSKKGVYAEVAEKSFISKLKFLNNTTVTKENLKEVKKITQTEKSGKFKIKYGKKNDKTIDLTEEQKKIIVDDGIPIGLHLIGTTSGLVSPGMHSTIPKFLQLNRYQKDTLFESIWSYCEQKSRKLICLRKYREDSAPKIFELSPCVINGTRSFLMLGVPFLNDFKNHPKFDFTSKIKTETNSLKEACEKFVTSASFDFDPLQIHSTVTCRKIAYIRSELLQETSQDIPDIQSLRLVDGEEIKNSIELMKRFIPETSNKRKRNTKNTVSNKKK